jgi:PII-like signaling protein
MKVESDARRVTVYVNSTDQFHGRPLYSAVVRLCQKLGIAGASVFRCVEGYGTGHHLHTSRLLELSENLPVCVEIIDVPERIEPLLKELDGIIGEGLVVVSDVHVIHYQAGPKA